MRKLLLLLSFSLLYALPSWSQGYTTGSITAVDTSATCSTSGGFVSVNVLQNSSSVAFTVSGTFSATLQFVGTVDGTSWVAVNAFPPNSTTAATSTTAPGTWKADVANFSQFCVRASGYVSGTATVGMRNSSGVSTSTLTGGGGGGLAPNSVGSPILTTANLIGDYRFKEGSGTTSADLSGVSGPVTLVNSPTWVTGGGVTCTSGSSQYITVPTSITTTAVSVEMYVNVQYTNVGAGADKALIINNGGGGTSNTSGIFLDTSSTFLGANLGASDVGSFKNGGFGQAYYNAFNGTGLVQWVKGASTDTIYVNGQVGVAFQNSGTSGVDTGNNFQICGAAAGSGFASSTYTTMTVYWVRFFSAALTAPQIAADYAGMSSIEAGNGFPVSTSATDQVAYDLNIGDSLTSGNGMVPFISLEILNNSMSIAARAQSGQTAAIFVGAFNTMVPYFYRPSAPIALANFWMGTNDALTAQQILGYDRQFCTQAHAIGFKCSLMTMIARGTSSYAKAVSINPLIRQLGPPGCINSSCADLVIDVAADTNFAPGNAATNSCYQADNIHYTTACSYNNITPIVQAAKNSLYGNFSFGTAATYSSAGGAAIATTAGSESTNTMTFTSAGWTAATFVVGTRMVCSGITPAGYNGVWQILSNGGTTVTAYNGTTGLGNISVQGTCQGEQLQQADNFAILNSGGNFLLSSCLDWVGRNVNLWNINGSSGTLVPFNSETFVGSTTVTSNAVAILSSVLTSNTAGGCKWVRLQ